MYLIICIHHKAAQQQKKQNAAFPGYIWNWQHMKVQPPLEHNYRIIWQQWKGWQFWFDYDNKISYKYILSIT